jgi:protein phosphatase
VHSICGPDLDSSEACSFLLAGTANNAGAILVLGRDLVVVPKLIHPLPPPGPANGDSDSEDTWMQELNVQRPPTPTRGRPQNEAQQRSSLAWI